MHLELRLCGHAPGISSLQKGSRRRKPDPVGDQAHTLSDELFPTAPGERGDTFPIVQMGRLRFREVR